MNNAMNNIIHVRRYKSKIKKAAIKAAFFYISLY